MSERQDKKIARVLSKCCPAFYEDSNQDEERVWHHSFCMAKDHPLSGLGTHCECVWHQRATCLAGTWPQLSFVRPPVKKESPHTPTPAEYLELARAAIARAMRKEE